MVLRKLKHTEVPVWIKLRHLPVELWTTEGLSTVASGIGRLLYPDAITRACTRLDFARVCVMLNVSSKLPKHVVIMMPNELGGESACKVDVEYEWLPPKCKQCVSLGHSTATCPESYKIEKPKVAVYVQKRPVQAPPTVSKTMAKDVVRTVQHTVPEEDGTVGLEIGTDERSYIDKGKAPLAKCDIMNAAFWNVRGLNRRDHQVAVKELVTNLVVDMSEVCGASADIHMAMNEFRDCILGTGLIHLPVQGELFSWHNCSEGDRSLWKRLDRLLVNDAWLRLWPNSHYQCLNARTSDHSPLVLRGDTDNHTKEERGPFREC
ncbi:hypothetical protein Sango_3078300 [Sesamum angolense]|uniref:DUF4283 domain-containing protein n=1 Tax=Sesamum angolense TaxID=2727404 RepID=A0AAE1W153_9LAMI|nr:hypothetical protein Sango_3078300 [Sesamum angolense]